MYSKNNPTLEYVLFLGMGGLPPVSIIKARDLGIAKYRQLAIGTVSAR
jgi:hypothetical protein